MLGQIAKANQMEIWFETFGEKENEPFLLIMGACCQGILWPVEFCEKLATEGYYVIRYDHRDSGLSTCIDFNKSPYNHLDMAKDALGLLDYLNIEKTHVLGLSTGGSIAQIMSAHYPNRIATLGLMATTADFRPCNLALSKQPVEPGLLSSPKAHYLSAMDQFINNPPKNEEEMLQQRIDIWQLLNGNKVPLEINSQRALHKAFLTRHSYQPGLENHLKANNLSEDLLRQAVKKITVPTVIFQGTKDPIFPVDHGKALHHQIDNSIYHLLQGHGHVPNPFFFDEIITVLVELAAPRKGLGNTL